MPVLRDPSGREVYLSDEEYQLLRNQNRSSVPTQAEQPNMAGDIIKLGAGTAAGHAIKSGIGSLFASAPATPVVLGAPAVGSASAATTAAAGAGGLGSNAALGLAGAGAFGLYDLFSNKRGGVRGPLQGAASGAAIGSTLPGIGTLVGAGVGGLLGLGQSIFGGKSKTKVEQDRRDALREQGIDLGDTKGWELNEAFKQSRNEADLTGKDITQAATLYGIFGDKWKNSTEESRIKVADEALKRGLIREHHGTIDLTDQPQDFTDFANSSLVQVAPKATSSGPARTETPITKLPKFKADPKLPLGAITPTYNAPAAQEQPDDNYLTLFNDYLARKKHA